MNISRRSFIFGGSAVAAGVGASALVGCNGVGDMATTSVDPGYLTAASAYSSNVISPLALFDNLSHSVCWHIYESLYGIDHSNGEIVNRIAEGDPEKIDDNTYQIEYKNYIQFSDGTYLTPDIIKNVFGVYMNDIVYGKLIDFIKSVDVVDSNKIQINLSYELDTDILKRRLCMIRFFKTGTESNGTYESILGTGPYALQNADGDDGHVVEFIPNGNYKGSKSARAKGMKWYIRTDDELRLKELTDGRCSVVEDIPLKDVDSIKAKGFSVDVEDSYSMPMMIFNTSHAPFNDTRIRQAVLYAFNDDKIIKDRLDGYAEVPSSYLPKSNPNFHECKTIYQYNPDQAKALLSAAGKPNLYFNLTVNPSAALETFVDEIRNDMGELGITCNIKVEKINWESVMDPAKSNEWDALLVAIDPTAFGSDTDVLLSSMYGDSVMLNDITKYSSSNGNRYEEIQKLLQDARTSSEFAQQNAWDKVQEIISTEVPMYPVIHRKIATAYNTRLIKDFKMNVSSGIYLLDAAPVSK